jgi:hypothetical protein
MSKIGILEEIHHCTECEWEGFPIARLDLETVPYGSTTATFEVIDTIWCAGCRSVHITEGARPVIEPTEGEDE